jgi:cob(I)alamin adenosyltransferase
VESVIKELEAYLFINRKQAIKPEVRGEATQRCLHSIINVMESMNDELAERANPETDGITKEQVNVIIDSRELVEWSLETAKKIIKKGVSPGGATVKQTTADL